jgi:hypothetical protein
LARSRKCRLLSNAFSAEFGWTAGPALEHRSPSLAPTRCGAKGCTWCVPAACRQKRFRRTASAHRRSRRAPRRARSKQSTRRTCRTHSTSLGISRRADHQRQNVLLCDAGLHLAGPDDVSVRYVAVVRASSGRQPHLRRALSAGTHERARRITNSPRRRT